MLTSEHFTWGIWTRHNSFTKDKDGNDIFVYHARSLECFEGKMRIFGKWPLHDPCRHARVRRNSVGIRKNEVHSYRDKIMLRIMVSHEWTSFCFDIMGWVFSLSKLSSSSLICLVSGQVLLSFEINCSLVFNYRFILFPTVLQGLLFLLLIYSSTAVGIVNDSGYVFVC